MMVPSREELDERHGKDYYFLDSRRKVLVGCLVGLRVVYCKKARRGLSVSGTAARESGRYATGQLQPPPRLKLNVSGHPFL
jgi:hypothetical protein